MFNLPKNRRTIQLILDKVHANPNNMYVLYTDAWNPGAHPPA